MAFTPRTPEQLAHEEADRRTAEIVAAIQQLEKTVTRMPLYFVAWSIILGILFGVLYIAFVALVNSRG